MSAGMTSLILRATLGTTMIAHRVKHGQTTEGTAGWLPSIGFREPKLQARLSAAVEIGARCALPAGAATPLAASAVVGTTAVAGKSVPARNEFFMARWARWCRRTKGRHQHRHRAPRRQN